MADYLNSTEEEEAVALAKHKNKLAQQRYRERQRIKKSSITHQIASLERQLARLETTHQELATKNRTLEGFALLKKPSPNTLHGRGHSPQMDFAEVKNEPAADSTFVCDFALCLAEFLNASRCYREPNILPEVLRDHSITPESQGGVRLEFAKHVAEILGKSKIFTPTLKKELEDYCADVRKKKDRLMRCHCHADSIKMGLGAFHIAQQKYDNHTPNLINGMNLTPDQIQRLMAAKQRFDDDIEEIKAERAKTIEAIRESVTRQEHNSEHPSTSDKLIALESDNELNQRLLESLEAEGTSMYLYSKACHTIILPLQEAFACVEAMNLGTWFELWDVPGILLSMQSGPSSSNECQTPVAIKSDDSGSLEWCLQRQQLVKNDTPLFRTSHLTDSSTDSRESTASTQNQDQSGGSHSIDGEAHPSMGSKRLWPAPKFVPVKLQTLPSRWPN